MKKFLKGWVLPILVVVLAWQAWQMATARTGETAPPLGSGNWLATTGGLPAVVDQCPTGWTLYAFFSPG